MRKLKKKAAVLMTAAAMAVTSLTGCGSFKNSDVVAKVGDTKITAGVVNYYARWNQASMESYYGGDMWAYEISAGVTYEDTMKESIMETLKQMYILDAHAAEYNITLTADEEAKIAETAKKVVAANDSKTNKVISAEEDIVAEVLRLITVSSKMEAAMVADVDTEVSDEEAAQKCMMYVEFPFSTTDASGNTVTLTDEEKELLKTEAEEFLAGVKGAEDFKAYAEEAEYKAVEMTFDSESLAPAKEVIAAADALAEGEVSGVVEASSGYYVVKLTSLMDEAATKAEKENIVEERKSEKFQEIYTEWEEATEYKLYEKVLDKIDFVKVGVTYVAEDTTEDTADDTTDDTTEDTTEE